MKFQNLQIPSHILYIYIHTAIYIYTLYNLKNPNVPYSIIFSSK